MISIRDIRREEYVPLGGLMAEVYAELEGFPTPQEQPDYYRMLKNIGQLSEKPKTRVLVALAADNHLLGGIVYFDEMSQYGSGGAATKEKNGSGIRLLAVRKEARGAGVGKALTRHCIELARQSGNRQLILHTTRAMQLAWRMYENLGFKRAEELDFHQGELAVFGFRLLL